LLGMSVGTTHTNPYSEVPGISGMSSTHTRSFFHLRTLSRHRAYKRECLPISFCKTVEDRVRRAFQGTPTWTTSCLNCELVGTMVPKLYKQPNAYCKIIVQVNSRSLVSTRARRRDCVIDGEGQPVFRDPLFSKVRRCIRRVRPAVPQRRGCPNAATHRTKMPFLNQRLEDRTGERTLQLNTSRVLDAGSVRSHLETLMTAIKHQRGQPL